jgi:hypothetical protein
MDIYLILQNQLVIMRLLLTSYRTGRTAESTAQLSQQISATQSRLNTWGGKHDDD